MIENLCHRPNCRTWISVDGFLVDGKRGAESINSFDTGFVHLAQKLSGVAGERFHETPLTFLVHGVVGQRGLSTSADAGDDDQGVAGDVEIHRPQIVLGRATNLNLVHAVFPRYPRLPIMELHKGSGEIPCGECLT